MDIAQAAILEYQIRLDFWDTTVLNARERATNSKNQ